MAGPLPSWNDGAAKSAILDFVARVTKEGGPDFVPPAERIATFDNDGTLWCEQPIQVQLFFLIDRVKELAGEGPVAEGAPALQGPARTRHEDPAWARQAGALRARLRHPCRHDRRRVRRDRAGVVRQGEASRSSDGCSRRTSTGRRSSCSAICASNGFKNFIVSGGGIDLIRAFAEEAYGIPREQVVGSSVKLRFEMRDSGAELMKLAELNSFDDREVKPANIGLHIGRRPILAFGNSDGDLAMLRYCKTGKGARLALLIHHDDAEREVAYDREFRLSPLVEALDKADEYGITVVSMKKDWKTVFAPAQAAGAAGRRMKEWLVYLSEHDDRADRLHRADRRRVRHGRGRRSTVPRS